MKTIHFKILVWSLLTTGMLLAGCKKNNNNNTLTPDFSGTYQQSDQMGRPAISTVFIAPGKARDDFNASLPSEMAATYQQVLQSKLLALNPAYTTNALGQTAAQLSGLLATDVLNVATKGTTTYFDKTHVLTGRALADDVIDVSLLLIFGGPDGKSNPGLTSDHVDQNDKPFLDTFPYLAKPW